VPPESCFATFADAASWLEKYLSDDVTTSSGDDGTKVDGADEPLEPAGL
jgi:hypothetical protein